MKKILGLDIGTNSIGGALITLNEFGKEGSIDWIGSRIIPLDGDALSKFENGGQVETKAAARRMLRSSRRLKQRYKLRRARLLKVFKLLGWVRQDFPDDFKASTTKETFFNINDYLPISKATRQEAYQAFGTDKISDDWLVYFLRKKALDSPITLQELARVIYMMNQRRGFKSSRREIKQQEDTPEDKWPKIEKWVEIITVQSVTETGREKDKATYTVDASPYRGEIVRRYKPDWQGKSKELEITRKTTKAGDVTYTFKEPETSDWEKQKKALQQDMEGWTEKGLSRTVGEYFLNHLIEDKNYRIRQRIVDRQLYQHELTEIWKKQQTYHDELADTACLETIATTLYRHNQEKQKEIRANNLFYVIANDIIYYQRSLKSQKHSIDECRFEKKTYEQEGIQLARGVKVAPKSSPLFQEFRIWQDIHNLRIYQREGIVEGKEQLDIDVTDALINSTVKEALFNLFDSSQEVSATAILKTIDKKLSDKTHRINLFANRDKLKGNEAKALFRKVFKKHGYAEGDQLLQDQPLLQRMWHILYSLEEEKDIASAFRNLKSEKGELISMPEAVIAHLSHLPELPKQYAAYSSKAIKKLLPLMRCGTYWSEGAFDTSTIERIQKIINGEWDENIDNRTRDLMQGYGLNKVEQFSGLPVWLATYVVYSRHSERGSEEKYDHPDQLDINKLIPANSLRNPFVEQIIRETLQVVKSVWQTYGQPDEIHIELARELKKTAEEKAKIAEANFKSQSEKERIKNLLRELKEGNPQSLMDIEKFRLWKDNGGLESQLKFDALFDKRNVVVSLAEVERYRLWADQNHLSPYTGRPIPLSLLFTPAYEVEHIFPRSRFFDDSFANKVICETAVNKEKDKRTARQFIQQCSGQTLRRDGQTFTLLDEESYVAQCKRIFKNKKLRNLLSESIPEEFVSRQLNDTRHISKKLAELLYPVTREKEGVIYSGGSITSELKDRWGLNSVWKELLLPRFQRLQALTGEQLITTDTEGGNRVHFAKDYKRVDHRHHALDALIIAATTREHIRYLNTLNATTDEEKFRFGLVRNGIRNFILPWPGFTKDAKERLGEVIVSHKATNRVVTKPFNRYLKWVEKDGEVKKLWVNQEQPQDFGKSWTAVRRSMFKEPQGVIYLKEVQFKKPADAIAIQLDKEQAPNRKGTKPSDYVYDQTLRPVIKELIRQFNHDLIAIKAYLKKTPLTDSAGNLVDKVAVAVFKEYAAKRVSLDGSFDAKKIDKIPYAHHQQGNGKKATLPQILRQHLLELGKPEVAFTGEGLELLHRKLGFPLRKVTIYEAKDPATKFKGCYYETDKGGNVFFVIKQNGEGIRTLYTLPLLEAIERLANKLPLVDSEEGSSHFTLSPNELVYVPDEEEDIKTVNWNDKRCLFGKVYKMVSCTGSKCYFLPHHVANLLLPYDAQTKTGEFGALNKSENTLDGRSIKQRCIKLKADRLGNIQPA